MAYQPKETVAEARTKLWAERNGWICEKVKFANAGYNDRIYFHNPGVIVLIEFKRVGKQPDDLQNHRIKVLRAMGILATWTDNYDDAVAFLAASVSDTGYAADARSGLCRVVSGPRPWEDGMRIIGIYDPSQERLSKADASGSSSEAGLQGMARRD